MITQVNEKCYFGSLVTKIQLLFRRKKNKKKSDANDLKMWLMFNVILLYYLESNVSADCFVLSRSLITEQRVQPSDLLQREENDVSCAAGLKAKDKIRKC